MMEEAVEYFPVERLKEFSVRTFRHFGVPATVHAIAEATSVVILLMIEPSPLPAVEGGASSFFMKTCLFFRTLQPNSATAS
jgi:hypothetical protein